MSLLESSTPSLAPVFQAPVSAAADTAFAAHGDGTGQESVRRTDVPADAAGSVYAPVAGFLAADPHVAEAMAYGDDSPTVMVSVPLSRAVLEAACLNATGPQEADYIPVAPEAIASWSDDQIRAWAIGEALDHGAGKAMDTVDGWQHQVDEAGGPSGPTYDLISDRIGRAFGFEPAADELTADVTDELTAEVTQDVDEDDDADGWEL